MMPVALKTVVSPKTKPPPYIHTATGSWASLEIPAGRNTFRVRQSSDVGPNTVFYEESMSHIASWKSSRCYQRTDCCAHAGPNCDASKELALMVSTGTGGMNRKLPTGGLANGSPKIGS